MGDSKSVVPLLLLTGEAGQTGRALRGGTRVKTDLASGDVLQNERDVSCGIKHAPSVPFF